MPSCVQSHRRGKVRLHSWAGRRPRVALGLTHEVIFKGDAVFYQNAIQIQGFTFTSQEGAGSKTILGEGYSNNKQHDKKNKIKMNKHQKPGAG